MAPLGGIEPLSLPGSFVDLYPFARYHSGVEGRCARLFRAVMRDFCLSGRAYLAAGLSVSYPFDTFYSYPPRPVPAEVVVVHHLPADEQAGQADGSDGAFQRREVEADAERGAEPPGGKLVYLADVQFVIHLAQDVVHRVAGDAQVVGHFLLRGTPGDALGYLVFPCCEGCGSSVMSHTSVMLRRANAWLIASNLGRLMSTMPLFITL